MTTTEHGQDAPSTNGHSNGNGKARGFPVPWSDADEAAMLGSMLLTRDAVKHADLMLIPSDFWRPAHAHIFEAMMALYHDGQPIDAVTVPTQLERAELLDAVGGKQAILRLQASVPASANHTAYARTVAFMGFRRRTETFAGELKTMARDPNVAEEDIQLALMAAEGSVVAHLADAIPPPPPRDVVDFRSGDDMPRRWIVKGLLAAGDRYVLTGGEGGGKALDVATPIPTPKGWTTMGDLTVGEEVFGADGKPTTVTFATEEMHGHECFTVKFSDGSQIVADAEHLWTVEDYASRNGKGGPRTVDTLTLKRELRARGGFVANFAIPTSAPIQYPAQEQPIDPYLLGAWLGDGHSATARISNVDDEILQAFRDDGWVLHHIDACTWSITGARRWHDSFQTRLRLLGVLGAKHIPDSYLHGSVEQRLALLQGLMDTDGTVNATGSKRGRGFGATPCEFSVTNADLAHDTLEILLGLGVKATIRESDATLNGRVVGRRWRLKFQTDLPVFRVARKAARLRPMRTRRSTLRYVETVEPVSTRPVRCIQVDAGDSLYLAGRACIPTHNTTYLRQLAVQFSAGIHPFRLTEISACRVLHFDFQDSDDQSEGEYAWIRDIAGDRVRRGNLQVIERRQGLNILSRGDRRWFERAIRDAKADIVVIGPLYKIFRAPSGMKKHDEEVAELVAGALDEIAKMYGIAYLIEAHSPKGHDGDRGGFTPIGASLWLRWPEFGHALKPIPGKPATDTSPAVDSPGVFLKRFRGDRDRNRDWPTQMFYGGRGQWPWTCPPEDVL